MRRSTCLILPEATNWRLRGLQSPRLRCCSSCAAAWRVTMKREIRLLKCENLGTVEMTTSERRFPSPKEFYRAQRPERFSDSVSVEKPSLSRSQLEYHLVSLTSRNQEKAFETFARGLAERRIAPNLIPHTG